MEFIKMTLPEMKETIIREANNFYNGRPTGISDAVYDSLLKFILDEDPSFYIYDHINYEGDGIKLRHDITFREFKKHYDIDTFINSEEEFDKVKSKYYILPKFDGSSTVSYYVNNKLNRILSRGDDKIGILNTNKLKGKVEESLEGVTRMLAEAVTSPDDLGLTCRNYANALVCSKYKQEDVDKYLTLIPFDYYREDGTREPNLDVELTDYESFKALKESGMYTYNGKRYFCDGVVCYNRDGSDLIEIHKFYYRDKVESESTGIQWEPAAESGIVHPTILYKQVLIDGTKCSKAAFFNYDHAMKHNYHPGMKLSIIRAGETIPTIHEDTYSLPENNTPEAIEKSKEYFEGLRCPYCGSKYKHYGYVDCVCSNDACAWWLKFISYRILKYYGCLTDTTKMMVYSDNQFKSDFMKEFLTNEKRSEIKNDIKVILEIVKIPRINAKKTEKIIEAFNKAKNASSITLTDDTICDIVRINTSDIQYEYFELMYNRLLGLLDILSY